MQTREFRQLENAAALEALKKESTLPAPTEVVKGLGSPVITKSLFPLFLKVLFLLSLMMISSTGKAQMEKWDSLTNQAKIYHQQKEYAKSNECYEHVIAIVKPYDEGERLTSKIRGMIALNYVYLGVPLFKEKKYAESKPYFEKAIEYSAKDPKVLPMANSWMGNWYSSQALEIRVKESNLQQAIDYYIMAENYYKLANAPEKYLKEQISRATTLSDISRIDEARKLLQQVIGECKGKDKLTILQAKALNELGAIEQNSENYQSAIQNLEKSYNLSFQFDRQNARIAANRIIRLYETQIPDKSKVELWKKRVVELKD